MIIDHPNWRAGFEDGMAPNCPKCLHPMEPRVEDWFCESCRVSIQPGTETDGR